MMTSCAVCAHCRVVVVVVVVVFNFDVAGCILTKNLGV